MFAPAPNPGPAFLLPPLLLTGLSTCIDADEGLGIPALEGEFGTGVSVAMGGSVTPSLPAVPGTERSEDVDIDGGGGGMFLSPVEGETIALGGGGNERVEGIPVVFVLLLGLRSCLSLSAACVLSSEVRFG